MVAARPVDARAAVLAALAAVAPEADLASLDPQANLRRELDLDSIDFQTFLIRLATAAGIDIPERDAGSLTTVAACVDYLARRTR